MTSTIAQTQQPPRVDLLPVTGADVALIQACIRTEADMVNWAGPYSFTWPLTREQIVAYLEEAAASDGCRTWSAADRSTGIRVGHVQLMVAPDASGHICRVLIAPERRGHGYGRALMQHLIRHAFDDLDLQRLTLNVMTSNDRARALYESLGFAASAGSAFSLRMSLPRPR